MEATHKPRIAFLFRYGPGDHTELLHALPEIIAGLAEHADVYYFGMQSPKPVPELIARTAKVHLLPFTVDRTRQRDKILKTLLWILVCVPWLSLRCRFMGIDAIYLDETIPLTAILARIFFGRNVAITVADFFTGIYFAKPGFVTAFGKIIRRIDINTWRKMPLIITRAKSTKNYLVSQGFRADHIYPVYDPCDLTIYHPMDRKMAKAKLNLPADSVVLVHHGILHPNKGNDRILRAIVPVAAVNPQFHFLLVGDGPEMENLLALKRELGLEKVVQFTGWLKTLEEVNVALNAGDIGLVMRVGEESDNFHLTGALVHSMACGLPVLAAHLHGIAEIVREGENGLLFPAGDMKVFQEKLSRLIGDRALREKLGTQGLADAIDYFDMGRMTQRQIEPLVKLVRGELT